MTIQTVVCIYTVDCLCRERQSRTLSVCSARAPLLDGHVRPVEGAAAEQHVSNESLDGCLADQTHKEQLFDDLR